MTFLESTRDKFICETKWENIFREGEEWDMRAHNFGW